MVHARRRSTLVVVATAVALLTGGCGTDRHPRSCDVQPEGPDALLSVDAAGGHRYLFLPRQQFVVIGDARSTVAESSSPDVASVIGSDVRGGHRYTRFVVHKPGATTVSRPGSSGLESASVVAVCHLPG